jgi:hypothetical protein
VLTETQNKWGQGKNLASCAFMDRHAFLGLVACLARTHDCAFVVNTASYATERHVQTCFVLQPTAVHFALKACAALRTTAVMRGPCEMSRDGSTMSYLLGLCFLLAARSAALCVIAAVRDDGPI